jgi:hypothetical protein
LWPFIGLGLIFCYVIICLHLEDFFFLKQDGKTFSIISWVMGIIVIAVLTSVAVRRPMFVEWLEG